MGGGGGRERELQLLCGRGHECVFYFNVCEASGSPPPSPPTTCLSHDLPTTSESKLTPPGGRRTDSLLATDTRSS